MAFLTKKSNCWTFHLRKLKYTKFEKKNDLFQFTKLSSNSVLNSDLSKNYSTTPQRNQLLFSATLNKQNFAFPLFNASSQHFMSTDSRTDNYQIPSLASEKPPDFLSAGGNEVTDQVIFTNSSIPDSSREIFDSASSLTSDLSSVIDVAEPTLASLGIASWYTPVGLVENLLEYLHVTGHWPWWVCIVAATATARVLMFPIFIKTQRNAAKFANHMPQLQFLQAKFGEARKTGNAFETSKYATEIMNFMKEHNISPMKNAMWPLAQAPVFISFFLALRDMSKLPVESMKTGGFSWITDLTIPDPYYVMPLVACSTLYIVLKIGAESGVRMENMKLSKYLFTALPVLMFPFCMNFQSAVLFYWCTNNFFTLGLVLLLKIENLRSYFGIPKMQKTDPKFIPKKKNFITSMKDAYQDQKVLSAIDEREKIDEIRFQKAGTGPIPRTYKYDPTKPRPGIAAAAAKRTGSS